MLITQSKSQVDTFLGRYTNPKTVLPYKLALQRFYTFLTVYGYTSLNQVNLEVLELFKADLEKDYSPKTCSMTIGTIKEFFKFLVERGVLVKNEAILVKCTRLNSREQKTFTLNEKEVGRILEVIYNLKDEYQLHANKVMILLMVNAGLRCDELAHLKCTEMELQAGRYVLTIKGKNSRFRYITLSQSVTNEIMKSLEFMGISGDSYIIQGKDPVGNSKNDKPMDHKSIWMRVKKLARKAGITKDISPHSMRRTCATILHKRGAPVEVIQRILGHENVATTHRYIDVETDKDTSARYALDLTGEAV
jgi:integrase/recombinase XerD